MGGMKKVDFFKYFPGHLVLPSWGGVKVGDFVDFCHPIVRVQRVTGKVLAIADFEGHIYFEIRRYENNEPVGPFLYSVHSDKILFPKRAPNSFDKQDPSLNPKVGAYVHFESGSAPGWVSGKVLGKKETTKGVLFEVERCDDYGIPGGIIGSELVPQHKIRARNKPLSGLRTSNPYFSFMC